MIASFSPSHSFDTIVRRYSGAISGTSANTNGVSTLDTSFSDPDMEMLRQAYNNLVLSLRR